MSHKQRKHKRYQPYKQVKMKMFSMPDPFGNTPVESRRKILRDIAIKAKATVEAGFPRLGEWFDTYDPFYVLSFCVFYFLTAERGVNKEAIEGKIDFGLHHLELLQAFALMRKRAGTPRPLQDKAEELRRLLKELTDSFAMGEFDVPADMSEADVTKCRVIAQMRSQTLAVRNWAPPEQTIRHLKSMFTGSLSKLLSTELEGMSVCRFIDAMAVLGDEVDNRINAHIQRLRPMYLAKDFDSVYTRYHEAFPDVIDDRPGLHRIFDEICGRNLKLLKQLLMTHADLRLQEIFTFSLDDITRAYGEPAHREGVKRVLREWSYEFGDLANHNPKHFVYSNPVLVRPFIRLTDESYFWALSGILSHTLPAMLEVLVPTEHRETYLTARSQYLEDQVEALCRRFFPDGTVYRGSLWRPTPDDAIIYENDILVIIDSTAIVIECKAHLVDPPARRGAELRLVDTLEDVVVSASIQAQRFVDFLKANPRHHSFTTKHGSNNLVDASRLLRFTPLSVTYENLGFISADLKNCVKAGLISSSTVLVPSLCLTDLEIIFEVLDSQAQRIHYLSRRAEVERTMKYLGDELDLLAFYLDSGFNIGDWEDGKIFLNLVLKSKELDAYFVGREDGVSVPKPRLDLSDWWRVILERVEELKKPCWTEIAYVFLNLGRRDQDQFQRQFTKLMKRVREGRTKNKHNWVVMLNSAPARRYAVFGFPYAADSREERNQMLLHMAAELEQSTPVLGLAILGVDVKVMTYPYDVLAYLPGQAPGAPDATRIPREITTGS